MPSGAKKRKAAKKKKEQAAQPSNATNHGNDDQRSQDERESGDGDNSPSSRVNENHQNQFAEGNGKSRKNDPSHHESLVADEESAKEDSGNTNIYQKDGLADKDDIKIEKELKPAENIEIAESSLEHAKSSSSSSSSSSSRSSWDDEIREIKKRDEKENNDSAVEVTAHSDVNKPEDSDSLPKQAVPVSANTPLSGHSANVIRETTVVMDSAKSVELESEEQIHMESISDETSVVTAVDTVNSDEDSRKSLPNLNENTAKGFPVSDELVGWFSGTTDFEAKENNGKLLPLSDPIPESKYVPEEVKESEVAMSSEKDATHSVVQRTTWLSCCGLFDTLTGSSR